MVLMMVLVMVMVMAMAMADFRIAVYAAKYRTHIHTHMNVMYVCVSGVAVFATRNRGLKVLDMSVGGTVLRCNDNVHLRPIHSIRLAAQDAAQPHTQTQIFLSAAPDGAVKLWDMRTKS